MRHIIALAAAIPVLIFGAPASAFTAPSGVSQTGKDFKPASDLPIEGVITNPDWVQKPGPDEFSRYYPPMANLLDMDGVVQISCTVSALGILENCKVDRETPAGLGFGAAALSISAYFHMKPTSIDGTPVGGGAFTTRIRFNMADDDARPPPATLAGAMPSKAALQLAQRLIAARSDSDHYLASVKRTSDQIRKAAERLDTVDPAGAKTLKVVADAEDEASAADLPAYLAISADFYARSFSEAELEKLVAFFEGPVGKALASREADIAAFDQSAQAALITKVKADVKRIFCEQIECANSATPASGSAGSPPK